MILKSIVRLLSKPQRIGGYQPIQCGPVGAPPPGGTCAVRPTMNVRLTLVTKVEQVQKS